MRRLLAGFLGTAVLTGTFLVLPVYAAPAPEPEPVAARTDEVPMGSVADPAPAADVQAGTTDPVAGVPSGAPALTVEQTDVDEFSLVGVTWADDPAVTDTVVQVRVQDAAGRWGAWTEVGREDAEQNPNAPSGGTLRGGTAPLWTGPSTGVQAELVTRSGAQPTDVRLDLVDPGSSPADAMPGTPEIQDTADAAMAMPDVYSRAQWGADEDVRDWDPEFAPTIKAAALHHTAGSNDYTADQVPDILRSIYQYHAVSLEWGDIGYNVLVDKFGRLWEGRYGGLASTVIGAHAGGFNTYTFGVSMLGDYEKVPAPQPMVDAVSAIIAWKFELYGVKPTGTTSLTSAGGGTARYAKGTAVTLPTIFGHRDVGATVCPGQYGYARLPEIRTAVATRLAGSITARYASDAGVRAALGTPVGTEQSAAGVTWQEYTKGRMYSSPSTGVHAITGAILAKYLAVGGHSALGAPTTDQGVTPDGVGRYNHFGRTAIYWTPVTGAHVVQGAIRNVWAAGGWERGPLGYPVSDEVIASDGRTRYSTFQRGTVLWTAETGAHPLLGAIEDRWLALGGLDWGQGVPTSDETRTPDGVGRYTFFSGGAAIYWSPRSGAHGVVPSVRTVWRALGYERGRLGYPTADEALTADGAGRVTGFERGQVYRSAATGAHSVYGSIATTYLRLGGATSRLGLPTRDEYAVPGGRRTDFQHGALTWNARTGQVTATYR
ncbi:N-acetylmuramoyl-L-alanine amidase [Geodermatophilus sp. URMC 64]